MRIGKIAGVGGKRSRAGLPAAALTAAGALAASAAIAPAQAAGSGLRGTFRVLFPKGHVASNAPCPPEVFCGVGSLAGYGSATISIVEESFEEVEGSSCLAVARTEEVDLLGAAGSLLLGGSGTFCRPGGSGESHASPSSYGGAGRFSLAFTVLGGDGVFAGASGSGDETMDTDGAAGVWHLAGTLAG